MMAKNEGQSAGGRPPEREEAKRAAVAVRTTPAIKALLVEAAEASGRSITQEIEARLEASFRSDRHLGGPAQDEFLRLAALHMDVVSERADGPWHQQWSDWDTVRSTLIHFLSALEPKRSEDSFAAQNYRPDPDGLLMRMKLIGGSRLERMKGQRHGA